MDLLTLLLPIVGGAVVWAYNKYTKTTGTDPLANRPILKALFEMLAKGLPGQQQINLATQLGLHTDTEFLKSLVTNAEGKAWEDALALDGPRARNAEAATPSSPPAPPYAFAPELVHIPIRLTISPHFLPPEPPPQPGPEQPGIRLAA